MALYPNLPLELRVAQNFWTRVAPGTKITSARREAMISLLFRLDAEMISLNQRIEADAETIANLQRQLFELTGPSDGP